MLEWSSIDGGIQITNYTGTEKIVHVPAVIEGKKFVSIGSAFSGNVYIEELWLPKSVKNVYCHSTQFVYFNHFQEISLDRLEMPNASGIFFPDCKIDDSKIISAKNIVIADNLKYYCVYEFDFEEISICLVNDEGLKRFHDDSSVYVMELTEDNMAVNYCSLFGQDEVIVNGVIYKK